MKVFVIEISFCLIGFFVLVVVVVIGVEFNLDLFEKIFLVIFFWIVFLMIVLEKLLMVVVLEKVLLKMSWKVCGILL